jgi:CubicO group peptidase (beta-lactamase class C family)
MTKTAATPAISDADAGVIPLGRMLAVTAKVLCSAVHVSGREAEEAFANSAPSALHLLQLPDVMRAQAEWRMEGPLAEVWMTLDPGRATELVAAYRAAFPAFEADWQAEERRLAGLGRVTRSARYTGDQGVMILPASGNLELSFERVELARGPRPSSGWLPAAVQGAAPDAAMRDRVARVVQDSFTDAEGGDAAILVTRNGHILGEGYAQGLTADMPLESWSMGKSVMSTLIGVLVEKGVLDLDAPAPVADWQSADDPRRAITLRHVLNMSSGLRCTGYQEPRADWSSNLAEHFHPYTQAIDVAAFATDRPLQDPPGTAGRYRNCDTLTLATIFEERVRTALGANPQSFPQDALFTPLGMHGLTHETDRQGRFIISGFNYGTARDWARLAHLYLRDGVWAGRRLLPEGWVDFVRTLAPGWETGNYGGQFWLNTVGEYPLPADTFFMAGGGGQFVFMLPAEDMVIVRQGHSRAWDGAKPRMARLAGRIMEAVRG